jgi:GntR family transcriptional repressor for pyruvate dehydrogenase complex
VSVDSKEARAGLKRPRLADSIQVRGGRGASEQVALQLQHYIQEAGLRPGDFLGREADLAADLGVSRPTLREALRLLSSGKLIRATKGPGGGIFVARTPDEGVGRSLSDAIATVLETGAVSLEELVDVQVLLEVPLAGRAAYGADERTLASLRDILAAEAAVDPDDADTLALLDAQFHRAIARATSNRMMQALTDWVFEVVQPSLMEAVRAVVIPSALLEQHRAVLVAIEKGDAVRAERAMREHLLYLADVLRLAGSTDGGPSGARASRPGGRV